MNFFIGKISAACWDDDDAEKVDNGSLVFDVDGRRWFLPKHGIMTSECDWWAHYLPSKNVFVAYKVDDMRESINARGFRVVYTPRKPGPPTNRGVLYPISSREVRVWKIPAHDSFDGSPLMGMARGVAGKLSELHFLGTAFARKPGSVNFAEAWQDMKGNDVQLSSGEWVQVKLDRKADESGNLYIQTHTRTKGTNWLNAV